MAYYTWDEINAAQSTSNSYDFGKQIASGTRDFACSLYKNYSGWWLTQQLPDNPVSDFLRGTWDSICTYPNSPGLPEFIEPGFEGGQCHDEEYYVEFWQLNIANNQWSFSGHRLLGAITGIWVDYNPGLNAIAGYIRYHSGAAQLQVTGALSPPENFRFELRNLKKWDNSPDNCGNPPIGENQDEPPESERRRPIPIPPSPDRPGNGWNIPLVYVPITNNFTVDVGGINITVDVGGVEVKVGDEGSCDLTPVLEGLTDVRQDLSQQITDLDFSVTSRLLDIESDTQNLPEILDKLRELYESLTDTGSSELFCYSCEDGAYSEIYQSTVLEFLRQGFVSLSRGLERIAKHQCEEGFVIAPPQRFIISPGASIPQILLIYRDIKPTGSWGNHRVQITIPHPSSRYHDSYAPIPDGLFEIAHGSWEGIAVTKSGCRVAVNSETSQEAQRVIDLILSGIVDPDQVAGSGYRVAERFGDSVVSYRAYIQFAYYYPNGSKDSEPLWFKRFPKPSNFVPFFSPE